MTDAELISQRDSIMLPSLDRLCVICLLIVISHAFLGVDSLRGRMRGRNEMIESREEDRRQRIINLFTKPTSRDANSTTTEITNDNGPLPTDTQDKNDAFSDATTVVTAN